MFNYNTQKFKSPKNLGFSKGTVPLENSKIELLNYFVSVHLNAVSDSVRIISVLNKVSTSVDDRLYEFLESDNCLSKVVLLKNLSDDFVLVDIEVDIDEIVDGLTTHYRAEALKAQENS